MAGWNLRWFPEWNSRNPTDVYGPAITVGAVGAAVVVAVLLMLYGAAYQTDSVQTGPSGTGMSYQKFKSAQAPDPAIEDFARTRTQPIVPTGGERLAREVHGNAPPELSELTVANYDRLVEAMRAWTGIPDLFQGDETYQTRVARRMIEMTRNLNENWDGHVASDGEGGVTCYTCHRGQPVPSGIWFKVAPILEGRAGWSAVQNIATRQAISTSLPHDALEKYLLEGEQIAVHDLEPRVPSDPSDPADRTWQNAERTYSLMNYFSHSLGRNCTFCHNTRAFYDGAQVTPQWATASLGIQMVNEMNSEYLAPLRDEYPENRLGPIHGDAPKAACLTCHKGYGKPMGGLDVISDYPELATSEAPTYE